MLYWTLVHNSLYWFSIVYLFGTFQESCLKRSILIFAVYHLMYLSLVIIPGVVFIRISYLVFFVFCKRVNNVATSILPRLIHRTELVIHVFLFQI